MSGEGQILLSPLHKLAFPSRTLLGSYTDPTAAIFGRRISFVPSSITYTLLRVWCKFWLHKCTTTWLIWSFLPLSPSLPFIPWSVDCRGSYEFFLLMYTVLRQSLFLDEVQSSSLSDAINWLLACFFSFLPCTSHPDKTVYQCVDCHAAASMRHRYIRIVITSCF